MYGVIKRLLSEINRVQRGIALPAVLAMLAIGSLLVVPSINYVASNIKVGTSVAREYKQITAADAGVEDALWKLKYNAPNFLDPYTIASVNGLRVDVDIDEVETIAGQPVGESGAESDWLVVNASVTYHDGIYDYLLSATNNGSGNIKIARILIVFPAGVDYVDDSTSSNLTNPLNSNPTDTSGSPETGIILVWENQTPRPVLAEGATKYHRFYMSGPPGMNLEEMEGDGYVKAERTNIGTVWLGNVVPYSITAEAKDSSGQVVTTIIAGAWVGNLFVDVANWRIFH